MKHFTFIFFFILSNIGIAQTVPTDLNVFQKPEFNEAIIYFKDGTSIEGIGRIKTNFASREEIIIFKIEESDKDEEWNYKDVLGITITYEGGTIHYEYLKIKKYSFYELYEVVTEGIVKLYKKRTRGNNSLLTAIPSTFTGKIVGTSNATSLNDLSNTNVETEYTPGSIQVTNSTENTTYYLKKENEEFPTRVKDNYIKSFAEYMKDCEIMVEKIKNHEYNLSELKDLVDYYNANCGE